MKLSITTEHDKREVAQLASGATLLDQAKRDHKKYFGADFYEKFLTPVIVDTENSNRVLAKTEFHLIQKEDFDTAINLLKALPNHYPNSTITVAHIIKLLTT